MMLLLVASANNLIHVPVRLVYSEWHLQRQALPVAGLPGEMFASVDKALDERTIGHNPERLNLLKGGIIYSNQVSTCCTYQRIVIAA
jgi:starch synthase